MKSEEDKVLKEDEFLPDLDDPTALSLHQKSLEGDNQCENELLSSHMNRALRHLREKFPQVPGLQSVDFCFSCKGKSLPQFDSQPNTFVQIFNIGDHWVCAINKFSKHMNEVYVYDSIYDHPNEELIVQLTSVLRSLTKPDSITIHMRPFCRQNPGSRTCGYYALGAALYLCHGLDPTGLDFQIETLISQVELLIHEKNTTLIPAITSDTKQSVNSLITKHKKLHCLCHSKSMPELMICCSVCSNRFHEKCVDVESFVKESGDTTWNGPCCIQYSKKAARPEKEAIKRKLMM